MAHRKKVTGRQAAQAQPLDIVRRTSGILDRNSGLVLPWNTHIAHVGYESGMEEAAGTLYFLDDGRPATPNTHVALRREFNALKFFLDGRIRPDTRTAPLSQSDPMSYYKELEASGYPDPDEPFKRSRHSRISQRPPTTLRRSKLVTISEGTTAGEMYWRIFLAPKSKWSPMFRSRLRTLTRGVLASKHLPALQACLEREDGVPGWRDVEAFRPLREALADDDDLQLRFGATAFFATKRARVLRERAERNAPRVLEVPYRDLTIQLVMPLPRSKEPTSRKQARELVIQLYMVLLVAGPAMRRSRPAITAAFAWAGRAFHKVDSHARAEWRSLEAICRRFEVSKRQVQNLIARVKAQSPSSPEEIRHFLTRRAGAPSLSERRLKARRDIASIAVLITEQDLRQTAEGRRIFEQLDRANELEHGFMWKLELPPPTDAQRRRAKQLRANALDRLRKLRFRLAEQRAKGGTNS